MAEKVNRLLTGDSEMARALAKALCIPIETSRVEGFELKIFAGQVAQLQVTHFVGEVQAGDFSRALSTFQFEIKQADEEVIS